VERRNGDWLIKNSKEIFRNDFFKVCVDDVIKPDGKKGEYATIRFASGVAVLPVDDEGFVYLTRQFRYAIGRIDIEAVAGSIEGEEALEAAKRETKEELGIEAEEWIDLGTIESLTSITICNSRQFLARGLTFGKTQMDGTEKIERVRIRLTDAYEMMIKGEITEGDTCILIAKAHAALQKKGSDPRRATADLRTGGGAS
jgi:ADP-ribose pyrophosphatase